MLITTMILFYNEPAHGNGIYRAGLLEGTQLKRRRVVMAASPDRASSLHPPTPQRIDLPTATAPTEQCEIKILKVPPKLLNEALSLL